MRGQNQPERYLDGLPVLTEHIHPDHCLVKLGIQRLDDLIV